VIVLGSLILGALLAFLAWTVLRDWLTRAVFLRENFRGNTIITAGGILVIAAVVVGELVLSALNRYDASSALAARDVRRAVEVAVVGFGLVGLLDDLAGEGVTSGYRGHLSALLRGEVTTGAVKILGGGVVALVATVMAVDEGLGMLLADAALVALSANLANLLDRRPGRVTKVALVVWLALWGASLADPLLAATALTVGAALGLLVPELREQLMLGDAGSNPLGAALAMGVVITQSPAVRIASLAGVLALNLVAERVSFTAVIERVGVLRAFDELGRRP
jgi:UDP-N-acetylmuramyl pentapeptide phosphotransferase/UDP-N-acetylglucosamine-1-phosphate transferase